MLYSSSSSVRIYHVIAVELCALPGVLKNVFFFLSWEISLTETNFFFLVVGLVCQEKTFECKLSLQMH